MAFFVLFFSVACLKQSAYAQPININDTDTLISIRAFRILHTMGNVEAISKAITLEATIVANDERNNLYKSISILSSHLGLD